MDADCYAIEHIIRDRIAEALAEARWAALVRQSNGRSPRARGIGRRLIELGQTLVKRARRDASTRNANPSPRHGGPFDDHARA